MTSMELNAELFRELSVIAEDESLMRKALIAIKKLATQKRAMDETEYVMSSPAMVEILRQGDEDIKNGKGRPSIDKYKSAAAKRDRKLLATILAGYEPMHLLMGYDGTRNKKGCDIGFESANAIIDRCALLYPGEA